MPTKPTILGDTANSADSLKTENNAIGEFFEDDINSMTENDADDDEMPLQAPKLTKKKEPKPREKRPQTEAQKAATAKMRQKLQEKWEKTRAEKAAAEEQLKKAMEEKVLKKAISIKKKQIKQEKALDVISDDDTPMEEIVPIIKRRTATAPAPVQRQQTYYAPPPPPAPVKPRIIFM